MSLHGGLSNLASVRPVVQWHGAALVVRTLSFRSTSWILSHHSASPDATILSFRLLKAAHDAVLAFALLRKNDDIAVLRCGCLVIYCGGFERPPVSGPQPHPHPGRFHGKR
jgi:hypothetical protein